MTEMTIIVVLVIVAATLAFCVGMLAYARGYRDGCAYCLKQLEEGRKR